MDSTISIDSITKSLGIGQATTTSEEDRIAAENNATSTAPTDVPSAEVADAPTDAPPAEVANATVEDHGTKTVEEKPAVEHETVVNKHETREQTVVDKERHQDHYHTVVQPVKDSETLPTEHNQEEAPEEVKEFNHDDAGPDVKAKVDAQNAEHTDTKEETATEESVTQKPTIETEQVHHHHHEVVQPVIEKETVKKTVTDKTIPVKEVHQEASVDEGVTVKPPISKEELEAKT